ncbi:hypothetical protein AVEN_261317-1 [Araneus ventricosus]|uniref:Pre-C2HC domain-containing protein n=1 Tax=Araneus ventricosus TaxID=182803 RepID=A0A4Y2J0D8_ARAVE|nr:hypothetical protein AVEN_261317-1 [Araneus ventricosus]
MVEKGKYVDSVPSASSDFKIVSPKNSAKIWPEESKSPIETSNKSSNNHLNFMKSEEQDKEISPPKVSIPAIKIKINDDYNLTLQEINRNFPSIENKYDCGYIMILPYSPDARTKIIELLNKSEKEYVISDAPEKPFKIVIRH